MSWVDVLYFHSTEEYTGQVVETLAFKPIEAVTEDDSTQSISRKAAYWG
jgi:hypothetical protein